MKINVLIIIMIGIFVVSCDDVIRIPFKEKCVDERCFDEGINFACSNLDAIYDYSDRRIYGKFKSDNAIKYVIIRSDNSWVVYRGSRDSSDILIRMVDVYGINSFNYKYRRGYSINDGEFHCQLNKYNDR